MAKTVIDPITGEEVISVAGGGTSSSSPAAALAALGAVPLATLNTPMGVLQLDSTAKAPLNHLKVNRPGYLAILDYRGKLPTDYYDDSIPRLVNGKLPHTYLPDTSGATPGEDPLAGILDIYGKIPMSYLYTNGPLELASLDSSSKLKTEYLHTNTAGNLLKLDSNAKVPADKLPTASPFGVARLDAASKITTNYLYTNQPNQLLKLNNDAKVPGERLVSGTPGGVAILNENNKVPDEHLPSGFAAEVTVGILDW